MERSLKSKLKGMKNLGKISDIRDLKKLKEKRDKLKNSEFEDVGGVKLFKETD